MANIIFQSLIVKKSGTRIQLQNSLKKGIYKNIQAIFLTQLHQDHYSGLPDLINYLRDSGVTLEYFISPQLTAQVDMWRKILKMTTGEEESKSLTPLLKSIAGLPSMPALTHPNSKLLTLLYENDPTSIAWEPHLHSGLFFAPVNPSPQQIDGFLNKALSGKNSNGRIINFISHAMLLKYDLGEDEHYALFTGDLEGSCWRQVKN